MFRNGRLARNSGKKDAFLLSQGLHVRIGLASSFNQKSACFKSLFSYLEGLFYHIYFFACLQ